ncbi:MAG: LCP family protein [Lachnospiraceae bacterium]|nr:LCP family protein [Lachnospiraceae bacterium]
MTYKKERAGFAAMLLFSQILLLIFTVDAALVHEVSIRKVIFPLASQEATMMIILVIVAILGYYLVPVTKWFRNAFTIGAGAMEIIFWIVSGFHLGRQKLLGAKEIMFMVILCALIAACCAVHCLLAPKKEKGNWFVVRVAESGCVVLMTLAAIYVSKKYLNQLLTPTLSIVMFGLCAAVMLVYWWFSDSVNHLVTVAVVIGQALAFVLTFVSLCRNRDAVDVTGTFFANKTNTQVLSGLALALVGLLALSLILHYLKNLQIFGKYASIAVSCLVVALFLILSGATKKTANAVGIDAEDATKFEEYCVYVMKNDPAQKLQDVVSYKIGYSAEGRNKAMERAIAKLKEELGDSLQLTEYEWVSDLAEALYAGEQQAAFFESVYPEIIDAGFEAIEDKRVFSNDTRALEPSIMIEYIENEEPDPFDDPGIDDPDPWVDPGPDPTVTPEPTGEPGTPTPTPKPGDPTPTPTPKEKEDSSHAQTKATKLQKRPDNSGKDVTSEPFTIYISGIDRYGAITTRSRSDVNLILAINPKTHEIAIVSTPRDSYVHIPGKTTSMKDKLTHAGLYGPEYSMATLENLYGISIDFYLRLNFSSVEKIVNLLGGVDAMSLYNFTGRFGNYQFTKGMNHMDGHMALAFARERVTVTGGDWTRAKHQIELLKGLINKVTTSAVLSNYQSLLNEATKSIQTDLTLAQMVSLASSQLSNGGKWHVSSYATTGDGSYQYCAAYKGKKLWVALLHKKSVEKSATLINRVLRGDHIADGEYKYDK